MTQTIAEAWMDEGRQQGLQQGRDEATLSTLRAAVLQVLRARFTNVGEEIQQHLATLNDPQRLQQALNQAVLVAKPDDLSL